MPYISYRHGGVDRVGVVENDLVVPLTGVDSIGPGVGEQVLEAAERDTASALPVEDVTLRPASPRAGKVFCVGLNYDEHIIETKREKPTYPVLFPKFASSFVAPGDEFLLPPESSQVDFEGELAVVIGRPGRRIDEAQALEHVLGYAIANDITMRDYQYKTHQWMQGKAWDNSTPLGSHIFTPDEFDLGSHSISTMLNGQVMQQSDLSHLIFTIARLIADISTFTRLECGDVILTGTPGGVGYRRDPQIFIRPGDELVVEIDGLGRLVNRAASEF